MVSRRLMAEINALRTGTKATKAAARRAKGWLGSHVRWPQEHFIVRFHDRLGRESTVPREGSGPPGQRIRAGFGEASGSSGAVQDGPKPLL